MLEYGLPLLFAVTVWWFGTGAILYLVGLPRRTHRTTLAIATVVAIAACYGLATSAQNTSLSAAYLAFGCSVAIWGWHEVAFLTGTITGPNVDPARPGLAGWRRFLEALMTILYHELAILATAAVVLVLTWNEPNQTGMWTFMVLWWMRLSAKLNLFLGVPNIPDEFLAPRLSYLKSYFRRRSMNALLPVSVGGSVVVTVLLVGASLVPEAGGFATVSAILLASLLGLAALEHCFFVLPVPVAEIWSWGLRSRGTCARNPLRVTAREGPAQRQ